MNLSRELKETIHVIKRNKTEKHRYIPKMVTSVSEKTLLFVCKQREKDHKWRIILGKGCYLIPQYFGKGIFYFSPIKKNKLDQFKKVYEENLYFPRRIQMYYQRVSTGNTQKTYQKT